MWKNGPTRIGTNWNFQTSDRPTTKKFRKSRTNFRGSLLIILFPIYFYVSNIFLCFQCMLALKTLQSTYCQNEVDSSLIASKTIHRHCSTVKNISLKIAQTCNFQVGAGTQKIFELGILVFFILNLNRWSYFCANMSEFGAQKILLLILLLKFFFLNFLKNISNGAQQLFGVIGCHWWPFEINLGTPDWGQ